MLYSRTIQSNLVPSICSLLNMHLRNLYISAAIACSTACMFGYGTGFIGGTLVLPSFNHHFRLDELSRHDLAAAQSLIVSIWLIGACLGVLGALHVCSRCGRKACLLFSALTYVLGTVLQLVPSNQHAILLFNFGRLLSGLGVGAGTLGAPLYISEISLPANRGALLGTWQVAMQLSALAGFWGAYISHRVLSDASDWQWALPVIFQVVPGVVLLVGGPWLPETPVWLAETDREDALLVAYAWLRGREPGCEETHREVKEYYETVKLRKARADERPRQGFLSEIASPPIRKRLVCGINLMTLMTLSGTNALNFFAPTIFMSAGFTSTSASLFLTGLFGFVKLAASLSFTFYFVRVKGNRFWIIIATALCSVSLFILAACVRTFEPGQTAGAGAGETTGVNVPGLTACLMVFIFAFFFGIGHGPIAWNFCAEVFPPHLSTKCCTITTCTQWLFQVVNAVATPFLLTTAGWYTWLIFGAVNAFTLIWCYLCLPETRHVPQGEPMDAVFEGEGDKKANYVVHVEDVEGDDITERTPLMRPPGEGAAC